VYDKKGNEAKLKITEIIDGKPSFTRADGTKATIELEKKEGVTSFKGLTAGAKAARAGSNMVKAITKKPTESDI
jgi:hypothetical protein